MQRSNLQDADLFLISLQTIAVSPRIPVSASGAGLLGLPPRLQYCATVSIPLLDIRSIDLSAPSRSECPQGCVN